MHRIQTKILGLAKSVVIKDITLRKIASMIEEKQSPQLIKHHLNQLIQNGLLRADLTPINAGLDKKTGLVYIPIYKFN